MGWSSIASMGSRLMRAAFTNLTQDHLDYHRRYAASYRAAKLKLWALGEGCGVGGDQRRCGGRRKRSSKARQDARAEAHSAVGGARRARMR